MTTSLVRSSGALAALAIAGACGGNVVSSAEKADGGPPGGSAGTGGVVASAGAPSSGAPSNGGAAGATSSGGASGGLLGASCSLNSDCYAALVCAFGKCRAPCNSTRDCASGVRCARDGTNGCLLPEEIRCTWSSDCPAPLVCSPDGQCRNSCGSDSDCVASEVCSVYGVCVEMTELTEAGGIIGVNPSADAGSPGTGAGTCEYPPLPADGTIDRPGSPPFVECYACHPALFTPAGIQRHDPIEPCKVVPSIGTPNDLPCGACTDPGFQCRMTISAFCDCDGPGPRPAFLDPNYFDGWLCECRGGRWSCWLDGISGASCSSCSMPDASLP